MRYNNIKKQPYFVATDKKCPTQIWTASTTKSKIKQYNTPQKQIKKKNNIKQKKMILKKPSLQHKTTLHIVHESNKQTSITYNT